GLTHMSERSFDPLTAQALQLSSTIAPCATTIGDHGFALLGRLVGPHALVPALRLRNIAAIGCVLAQVRERLCAVIAFVSHGVLDLLLAARFLLMELGRMQAI